jgi:hypothetical protein
MSGLIIAGGATEIKALRKQARIAPLVDPYNQYRPGPYKWWGATDNKQPYFLLDTIKSCGLLGTCIDRLASYTESKGIYFWDEDAEQEAADKQWQRIWNAAKGDLWLNKTCYDYWAFGKTFAKFIMNREDKPRPMFIVPVTASMCRLEKQNLQTRAIENVYVSNQWLYRPIMQDGDPYMDKFPLLDTYMYSWQLENANVPAWFMTCDNYNASDPYYGSLPWHSEDTLNHISNLTSAPVIEKNIFKNSMGRKFHFEVDDDYLAFRMKFKNRNDPNFIEASPKSKQEALDDIRQGLDAYLTGEDGLYKSIITTKFIDDAGVERKAVTITPIETIYDKDKNIPSQQNAVANIMMGFGLDGDILGAVLGDTKFGGGGSSKEAAIMTLQMALKPHRTNILYQAKVFMEQWGLPANIQMKIRDYTAEDFAPKSNNSAQNNSANKPEPKTTA